MRFATLALTLTALCWSAAARAERIDAGPSMLYQRYTDRPYQDVVDDVEFAVVEENFRITGRNVIGKALAERAGRPFPQSVVIHFCNLQHARRLLEAAPEFLVQMPCRIIVYETADAAGTTAVVAPLVPEHEPRVAEMAREINRILTAIVDFAVED